MYVLTSLVSARIDQITNHSSTYTLTVRDHGIHHPGHLKRLRQARAARNNICETPTQCI
jgi:hypothetical protein